MKGTDKAAARVRFFSCGLSSGARGGSGISETLDGVLSDLAPCQPAWSKMMMACARGATLAAIVEMKLHRLGVAHRQHQARAFSVLGARVPIILTSRADKTLTRLGSCAIALLVARHKTGVKS